ncbi:MAG: crotonase/enoyl-CoA hydratase family protein [Candidatus Heimdallarchaeota archaeon]|nr:MAG: crotonase/enoyl-CoA hydratase family protein [Candidatus Heimdallarchaeota archaeon]
MGIKVEKKRRIWTIIIDNPEVRNAVDGPTANALANTFRNFEAEEEAKVAVLWGDHGYFCSGANMKTIQDGLGNRVEKNGDGPMGPTRMVLSKPVIAAVSGYAVAGGFELALWCDLRIVEKTAVFGVFNRRWGVPLIDGGTVRLPRLIGLSRALDLVLTGRPVSADEALAIGLANRIVEDGKSRIEAEKLALDIAKFPQTCLREDRLSTYEQYNYDWEKALANEFNHGLISLKEAKSGINRFINGEGRHGEF